MNGAQVELKMIRVGVIGCGLMAKSYLSGLRSLEPRMKVVALCDNDPARLKAAAPASPDAVLLADYRQMFEHVDAVIIALPHDLHHAVGVDCLKAGKHVLLEKPMANTEQHCLDLIHTAQSAGRVLCIGYVMRHDVLWTRMGQYLREKTFGEVFQVSIWTEQLTDVSRGAWIGQAKRVGGGQLFSHGCHYIDLLLHWMGKPIEGTHVGTNLGTPWMEWEGTSNVSIRFASGALGYHMGTWGARGSRLRYSVHAHCVEGMLELDHAAGTITLHRDASGGDLPALKAAIEDGATPDTNTRTTLFRVPVGGKATNAEVTEFLDCIEQGKPPIVTPEQALQSLRVVWRLYDAEQRHVVANLRGLGLDEYSADAVVGMAGQVLDA